MPTHKSAFSNAQILKAAFLCLFSCFLALSSGLALYAMACTILPDFFSWLGWLYMNTWPVYVLSLFPALVLYVVSCKCLMAYIIKRHLNTRPVKKQALWQIFLTVLMYLLATGFCFYQILQSILGISMAAPAILMVTCLAICINALLFKAGCYSDSPTQNILRCMFICMSGLLFCEYYEHLILFLNPVLPMYLIAAIAIIAAFNFYMVGVDRAEKFVRQHVANISLPMIIGVIATIVVAVIMLVGYFGIIEVPSMVLQIGGILLTIVLGLYLGRAVLQHYQKAKANQQSMPWLLGLCRGLDEVLSVIVLCVHCISESLFAVRGAQLNGVSKLGRSFTLLGYMIIEGVVDGTEILHHDDDACEANPAKLEESKENLNEFIGYDQYGKQISGRTWTKQPPTNSSGQESINFKDQVYYVKTLTTHHTHDAHAHDHGLHMFESVLYYHYIAVIFSAISFAVSMCATANLLLSLSMAAGVYAAGLCIDFARSCNQLCPQKKTQGHQLSLATGLATLIGLIAALSLGAMSGVEGHIALGLMMQISLVFSISTGLTEGTFYMNQCGKFFGKYLGYISGAANIIQHNIFSTPNVHSIQAPKAEANLFRKALIKYHERSLRQAEIAAHNCGP